MSWYIKVEAYYQNFYKLARDEKRALIRVAKSMRT